MDTENAHGVMVAAKAISKRLHKPIYSKKPLNSLPDKNYGQCQGSSDVSGQPGLQTSSDQIAVVDVEGHMAASELVSRDPFTARDPLLQTPFS